MKIYLVGGAVRDKLLGLPVKEKDWVVVGATVEEMLKLGYRLVGKEFPVFIHPVTKEEYALARTERKIKPGYKGFTVDSSTTVNLEEDLERRDLTINAMAETLDGQLIDPYGGEQDLHKKILRHVSTAFAEDPVRILRVGRFLARYAHLGFKVADETILLMKKMVDRGEVNALVAERVWKELERALKEKNPEQFLMVLHACHALPVLFPHLRMDGLGIKALMAASPLTAHPAVRFAALCHALPEEEQNHFPAKETITKLCKRYRIPNTFSQLAILTALHYTTALQAKQLTAENLYDFFNSLDIYRRETRFDLFLTACAAIAKAHQKKFDAEWLKNCAIVAKSYDVHELLAQDITGKELVNSLKIKRTERIAKWLKEHTL